MAELPIDQLVPTADVTADVDRALRAAAPGPLIEAVADLRQPWWRRRACVRALAGRVDEAAAARLLPVVSEVPGTTEVKAEVLQVLAQPGRPWSERLLQVLRALPDDGYGLAEAAQVARAALGDVTAVPQLVAQAASPWSSRRRVGEQALERLIEAQGLDAVLSALGAASLEALAFEDPRAAHRLLGLRLLHERGGELTPALVDEAPEVAQLAAELLSALPADEALDDRLLGLVHERRSLWALLVFHRRGRDIVPLWTALGRPRVEVPGVPEDVRLAILREYCPGERGTDPRWLVEHACTELPEAPDEEALLARAGRALAAFAPGTPISAGEHHQQGGGSYFLVPTSLGELSVSTLGPFVALGEGGEPARAALEAAGFRIIEGELASRVVEGLCVYFFGDRDPLRVHDLLFYWQD